MWSDTQGASSPQHRNQLALFVQGHDARACRRRVAQLLAHHTPARRAAWHCGPGRTCNASLHQTEVYVVQTHVLHRQVSAATEIRRRAHAPSLQPPTDDLLMKMFGMDVRSVICSPARSTR